MDQNNQKTIIPIPLKYFPITFFYSFVLALLIVSFVTVLLYPVISHSLLLLLSSTTINYLLPLLFFSAVFSAFIHFDSNRKSGAMIPSLTIMGIVIVAIVFFFIQSIGIRGEYAQIIPLFMSVFSVIALVIATFIGVVCRLALRYISSRILFVIMIFIPVALFLSVFFIINKYQTPTASACRSLKSNSGDQIYCYDNLARQQNNVAYCFEMAEAASNFAKSCFDYVTAKVPSNSQVCDALNGRAHEACIWVYALRDNDPTICSKAEYSSNCASAVRKGGQRYW